MSSLSYYGIREPYSPPDWAKGLAVIPKSRVKLAQLPTPIHQWPVPDLPDGFELYIKRDDLTGAALSGNKVRKLEFIFAEAIEQGCDTVITGGGLQSNHARATAMVARELGMDSTTVLYLPKGRALSDVQTSPAKGNLLLERLVGCTVEIVPFIEPDARFQFYSQCLSDTAEKLRARGQKPCTVELGGANAIGCWGYIEGFREMMEQGVLDSFDDIVVCMGTGGTGCGLGLANYLTGSKLRVHGICMKIPSYKIAAQIDGKLCQMGAVTKEGYQLKCSDIISMIDSGIYGRVTEEDLAFLTAVSTQTGIILDTVFTLNTVRHMLYEMKTNPGQFKGHRVLFLHTGGLFGLCDDQLEETILKTPETNRVKSIDQFIDV